MGAEALVALGLDAGVPQWTARSHVTGRAPAPTGQPVDPANWYLEVGDYARPGDWVQFFGRRLGSARTCSTA